MENSDETPFVNLSQYRQLTKNNRSVLQELIQMTIDSFDTYKNEFQRLIKTRDKKETGLLAHKLKTTIILLEANALDESIKEARNLLEEEADQGTIEAAIQNIHQEFNKCSKELEQELTAIQLKNKVTEK
ncbi:hypothetical protein BH23BAC1_BH23BAC1_29810 [soil metagenome]